MKGVHRENINMERGATANDRCNQQDIYTFHTISLNVNKFPNQPDYNEVFSYLYHSNEIWIVNILGTLYVRIKSWIEVPFAIETLHPRQIPRHYANWQGKPSYGYMPHARLRAHRIAKCANASVAHFSYRTEKLCGSNPRKKIMCFNFSLYFLWSKNLIIMFI